MAWGEDLDGCRRIIPRTVHAATGDGAPLRVFGTDFDTPDGSAVRDYVHVCDVAQANLLALRYVEQGAQSTVMNIAAGTGVSVLQIIDEVSRQAGGAVPYRLEKARAGDPGCAVADISRARKLLGWEPTASRLEDVVGAVLKSAKIRSLV